MDGRIDGESAEGGELVKGFGLAARDVDDRAGGSEGNQRTPEGRGEHTVKRGEFTHGIHTNEVIQKGVLVQADFGTFVTDLLDGRLKSEGLSRVAASGGEHLVDGGLGGGEIRGGVLGPAEVEIAQMGGGKWVGAAAGGGIVGQLEGDHGGAEAAGKAE